MNNNDTAPRTADTHSTTHLTTCFKSEMLDVFITWIYVGQQLSLPREIISHVFRFVNHDNDEKLNPCYYYYSLFHVEDLYVISNRNCAVFVNDDSGDDFKTLCTDDRGNLFLYSRNQLLKQYKTLLGKKIVDLAPLSGGGNDQFILLLQDYSFLRLFSITTGLIQDYLLWTSASRHLEGGSLASIRGVTKILTLECDSTLILCKTIGKRISIFKDQVLFSFTPVRPNPVSISFIHNHHLAVISSVGVECLARDYSSDSNNKTSMPCRKMIQSSDDDRIWQQVESLAVVQVTRHSWLYFITHRNSTQIHGFVLCLEPTVSFEPVFQLAVPNCDYVKVVGQPKRHLNTILFLVKTNNGVSCYKLVFYRI